MFLVVYPNGSNWRKEDIIRIDLSVHLHGGLSLHHKLSHVNSFCPESLTNERIATCRLEDYDGDEEVAMNAINEEVGGDICEILNFILEVTGKEVGSESKYEVVEYKEWYFKIDGTDDMCSTEAKTQDEALAILQATHEGYKLVPMSDEEGGKWDDDFFGKN